MALIKTGYWQDTYWASRYWQEDYWPEYGVPSVGVGGGKRRGVASPALIKQKLVKPLPLDRETLTLIKEYLELKQNA